MSNFIINIKIVKVKSEQNEIHIICPYCNHVSKTIDGFRMHITRNHSTEIGIIQVKKQAGKLWRLYQEARN